MRAVSCWHRLPRAAVMPHSHSIQGHGWGCEHLDCGRYPCPRQGLGKAVTSLPTQTVLGFCDNPITLHYLHVGSGLKKTNTSHLHSTPRPALPCREAQIPPAQLTLSPFPRPLQGDHATTHVPIHPHSFLPATPHLAPWETTSRTCPPTNPKPNKRNKRTHKKKAS